MERREVLLDRLDPAFDGFTIAAVSDIHLGPLVDGADLAAIVAMVNGAGPDIVAVVGDLVDGGVAELRDYAAPLRDLTAPAYFVTGNHEYFSDAADWVAFLPTLGLRVLRNERVELRRGPADDPAVLDLVGCDDRTAAASGVPGHGLSTDGVPTDLDAALAGRDPSRPVVLLAHQPVMVAEAARAGVDLQISGHTPAASSGRSPNWRSSTSRCSPASPGSARPGSTSRAGRASGARPPASARHRRSAC